PAPAHAATTQATDHAPEDDRDGPASTQRRSRPVDSGIPTPSLDEALLGPIRAFADGPDDPVDSEQEDEADRDRRDRGAGVLLVLMATAVLLLFVASQAALFLDTLAGWPPILREIGYVLAAALGLLFAISAVGLVWRYLVLPVSPGLRLDRADSLSSRRSVQLQARRNVALAKRRLREFLERYPTDARHRRFLAATLGGNRDAARERVDRLLAQRDRLLSHDHATDADWVHEFENRILAPLDELAGAIITRHAVSVGWKTAVVPTGFLDGLIVAANAYHLIGALCRLYHLRADSWSTLKITLHVFANTFVAGRLEDFADAAADQAFEQLHDLIGAQIARSALSRVSSGVTQGTVNGLLLRRFGRFALRSLRPIRP
ncbi:YcjF family protein, partial [Tautonia sociabilis]